MHQLKPEQEQTDLVDIRWPGEHKHSNWRFSLHEINLRNLDAAPLMLVFSCTGFAPAVFHSPVVRSALYRECEAAKVIVHGYGEVVHCISLKLVLSIALLEVWGEPFSAK